MRLLGTLLHGWVHIGAPLTAGSQCIRTLSRLLWVFVKDIRCTGVLWYTIHDLPRHLQTSREARGEWGRKIDSHSDDLFWFQPFSYLSFLRVCFYSICFYLITIAQFEISVAWHIGCSTGGFVLKGVLGFNQCCICDEKIRDIHDQYIKYEIRCNCLELVLLTRSILM